METSVMLAEDDSPPLAVNRCHQGDALELAKRLPDSSIHCIVTSPPYWNARDYGVPGQIGLEKSPQDYVERLVVVFGELHRALRDDGTLWLNLGDTYAGHYGSRFTRTSINGVMSDSDAEPVQYEHGLAAKNLLGLPWRIAFALQRAGWILRADIIWHKVYCAPESVKDRPSKKHEYLFMLAKSKRYHYDFDAIAEPLSASTIKRYQTGWHGNACRDYPGGRQNRYGSFMGSERAQQRTMKNKGSVWSIPVQPSRSGHCAAFPPALVEPCILAGCPRGGIVLDPFAGSGTTLEVAAQHGRLWMGFEINPAYVRIAEDRLAKPQLS